MSVPGIAPDESTIEATPTWNIGDVIEDRDSIRADLINLERREAVRLGGMPRSHRSSARKVLRGSALDLRGGPCAGDLGDTGIGKLAKAGQPSRAGITEAATGQRTECVMLDKSHRAAEMLWPGA